MSNIRIGIAQIENLFNHQAALNLHRQMVYGARATGVKLLCFPELSLHGYFIQPDHIRPCTSDSALLQSVQKLSQETGITILAGFIEKDKPGNLFIAHGVFFPWGERKIYRKTHLGKKEKTLLKPGNELPVFEHPEIRFGIALCVEWHLPEVITALERKGAEIIFGPHAVPYPRDKLWIKYLPARAYDNRIFVGCCNLWFKQKPRPGGGLMAINPRGEIIRELYLPGNQLVVFEIAKEEINRYRHPENENSMQHFLFQSLRRPELYQL